MNIRFSVQEMQLIEQQESDVNKTLTSGCRICWQYIHHLNSKRSTIITKYGVYYGNVKHKKKFLADGNANPLAVVQFDGNKTTSRIPLCDLIFQETSQL